METSAAVLAVTIFSLMVAMVTASAGDKSWIFQKCLRRCKESKCSNIPDAKFAELQPFHARVLQWTCPNECGYWCMWETVEAYQKDRNPTVPQFYGKWPFIRIWGMQEPASVLFSLLNLITNVWIIVQFRRLVPSSAPMYYTWHLNSLCAINAWTWSIVFHARDNNFTEMMDYFSAILLILCSFFALCVRLLTWRRWYAVLAVAAALISFYTYHVHYLAFVRFDYGYNMKANVAVGLVNTAGWLCWCYIVRLRQPYVWKAATSVVALNILISLELLDFPPFWWTLDAHSLWHAGTVLIPLLWGSFVVEDTLYLAKRQTEDSLGDILADGETERSKKES